MVKKVAQERKSEIAAAFILLLWVVAWLVSIKLEQEIPQALNFVMPMASATLLGIKLPVVGDKKEPNGTVNR